MHREQQLTAGLPRRRAVQERRAQLALERAAAHGVGGHGLQDLRFAGAERLLQVGPRDRAG